MDREYIGMRGVQGWGIYRDEGVYAGGVKGWRSINGLGSIGLGYRDGGIDGWRII